MASQGDPKLTLEGWIEKGSSLSREAEKAFRGAEDITFTAPGTGTVRCEAWCGERAKHVGKDQGQACRSERHPD